MKLKNKKTGEIIEFDAILPVKDVVGDSVAHLEYSSLAELNEEWEDYEEPKGYYYVTTTGLIKYDDTPFCAIHKDRKQIGNYFDTKEEAEKAVEKLKAWKRLKDEYDFKFTGWKRDEQFRGDFIITAQDWSTSDDKLLDLLFGGGD